MSRLMLAQRESTKLSPKSLASTRLWLRCFRQNTFNKESICANFHAISDTITVTTIADAIATITNDNHSNNSSHLIDLTLTII